jgi:Na+-translocating ferredoxin:NAD+ oxidoreductase RNF subunit RnfB
MRRDGFNRREQLKEIERLVQVIDGRDCAMCGAPDCRTFAEDVVRGKVSLDECLLVRARDKVTDKDK